MRIKSWVDIKSSLQPKDQTYGPWTLFWSCFWCVLNSSHFNYPVKKYFYGLAKRTHDFGVCAFFRNECFLYFFQFNWCMQFDFVLQEIRLERLVSVGFVASKFGIYKFNKLCFLLNKLIGIILLKLLTMSEQQWCFRCFYFCNWVSG